MSEPAVELVGTTQPQTQEIVESKTSSIFSNQDLMQKLGVIPTVLFELYKVMVSSFLILFVPQNCDGHVCTLSENLVTPDNLYTGGLVIIF